MSVCNLFRTIKSDEQSIFYTFSEYVNDLADAINKETNIEPSGFICMNLQNIDTDSFRSAIQNFYENLQCCERDSSIANNSDYSYKRYLLGGLMEMLKKGTPASSSSPAGSSFLTDDQIYRGDIDIVGTDIKDGMKYSEIICYLEPNSKINQTVSFDSTDKRTIVNNNPNLKGYGDDHNTAWTGSVNFNLFNPTPVLSYGSTSFNFNAILILYRYNGIEDIPLGLYVTKQPVTKYISSPDIYGQGTSYALRICMRFASTTDSSSCLPDINASTEDYTAAIVRDVQLIDRMNLTIDRFNTMSSKFNDYFNKTQELIHAYNEASRMIITWRELSLN